MPSCAPRACIVAKGIDNVPMPCHIIVVLVLVLCLPHEFGAQVGDADTGRKSMLVAAVEKNSEFVRMYSLVGMTEANTAEWQSEWACAVSQGVGAGRRGQSWTTAPAPRPAAANRIMHARCAAAPSAAHGGAMPCYRLLRWCRARRFAAGLNPNGRLGTPPLNPASARCFSSVRSPVKTRLNRLAPVS